MAASVKALVAMVTLLGTWWALPPRALFYPGGGEDSTLRELNDIAVEISQTHERLERPLIVRAARGEVGVTVADLRVEGSQAPPPFASAIEEAVAQAGRAYEIDHPLGELILAFTNPWMGSPGNDLPQGPRQPQSRGWITQGADGRPSACFTRIATGTLRGFEDQLAQWGSTAVLDQVGPCLLPHWFGAPGDHVGEWYAERGRTFARRLPGTDRWTASQLPSRGWFGRRTSWGWGYSPAGEGCRAGYGGACERAVVGDRQFSIIGPEGNLVMRRDAVRDFGNPFAGHSRALLFEVLAEFGPERFHRFWTSDEEPAEAFEVAFEVSLDRWVSAWTVTNAGGNEERGHRGPGLPPTTAAGVILLVCGFGGVGAMRARQRAIR